MAMMKVIHFGQRHSDAKNPVQSSFGESHVPREKEMDTRKIVSLPAQLAKAIEDFRFGERISTEAEAIRRLIEAGLEAYRRKSAKGADPKKP